MFSSLNRWVLRRRRIRCRWQSDAKILAADQPRTAYYEGHRRAANARARGDVDEFWHWTKVAAEVARICPTADMDLETLKRLVDRQSGKH